jgi:hypothetical protein
MQQLTLADEIVVLMLDDKVAEIKRSCAPVAAVAVAGGLLMELALQGRIDTDLDALFLVDPAPTGDALLDATLQEIAAESQHRPSAWWIHELAARHGDLVLQVLERLVAAGILREESRHFLWVFSRRSYPKVSGREEREAKARLMAVLFEHVVPDPRDTLLLGLAHATGALAAVLTPQEMRGATRRIAEVVSLEEIGRAVGKVSYQVWQAVGAMMMTTYPR